MNGLLYVTERLPKGIEECQFINLTADEGDLKASFDTIVPKKRRRNCYRIDRDLMHIEITRGRSDIYDSITHLTFLCIESHKLMRRILKKEEGAVDVQREWTHLEAIVLKNKKLDEQEKDVTFIHLGSLLGRTFKEIKKAYEDFATIENPDRFFYFIYALGQSAIQEETNGKERIITFSDLLKEQIGQHIYGEIWAKKVKEYLLENSLIKRPVHIISANMHSVLNTLYAEKALNGIEDLQGFELFEKLSIRENRALRDRVKQFSKQNGLCYIKDQSGANINVQIIDTAKISFLNLNVSPNDKPILIVMDYAFGEQAYETMDELLKPYLSGSKSHYLNVLSISIMGKAGILEGGKGDIMIPKAHVFEGTADNYPFKNEFTKNDLAGFGSQVYEGAMITVLGTSLQNREVLNYFYRSTWNVIGLEMEGAHYQKAIQAASKIRNNISEDVKVRYAYYASDNPLKTGSTLASGGLGTSGVRPTYAITQKIIEQILIE